MTANGQRVAVISEPEDPNPLGLVGQTLSNFSA